MEKLYNIFDIAHVNAMSMMTNEIDKKFLESQRKKGRPGCLLGHDGLSNQKERRKAQREMAAESRKRKHIDTLMEAKLSDNSMYICLRKYLIIN